MKPLRVVFALWCAATPLAAQDASPAAVPQPPAGRTFFERVAQPGKWVTGAGAVLLIALGAREHARAQDSWDALFAFCRQDNRRCARASDGSYVSFDAERLYQESLYYDRRAHRRIVAGQVALALAGTMFIVDLSARKRGPPNKPFEPEQAFLAPASDGGVVLGLRLGF